MTLTDIVWNQTRYEAGRYTCDVTRCGDHGRLTVQLVTDFHSIPIHSELVECETAQTDAWRTRALAVITNPDLRRLDGHD